VVAREDGGLYLVIPGRPEDRLVPYKGLVFRVKEFSDVTFEFVMKDGEVSEIKQRDPSGEYVLPRR
jgi:hypothetical protein